MGRKNGSRQTPQRSRLVANREQRTSLAGRAFSLFRPVGPEATDKIYERTRSLQLVSEIPERVELFNHDLHSTIVQEKRVREALLRGLAVDFTLAVALAHMKSGMPNHGSSGLLATITGIEVVGRNRNIIVGKLADDEGVLERQRQVAATVLRAQGLRGTLDKYPHVTIGVCEDVLASSERQDVKKAAGEALVGVEVELLPILVEHKGQRMSLDEAKNLAA